MIPASLENTHECGNDNEDNIHQRTLLTVAMITGVTKSAHSQDVLKVAVPQRGSWDAGLPELGTGRLIVTCTFGATLIIRRHHTAR